MVIASFIWGDLTSVSYSFSIHLRSPLSSVLVGYRSQEEDNLGGILQIFSGIICLTILELEYRRVEINAAGLIEMGKLLKRINTKEEEK